MQRSMISKHHIVIAMFKLQKTKRSIPKILQRVGKN